MNILIRCDSSPIIGTGHVMRCLNYTEYYPDYKFTFVCRNYENNISNKIEKHTLILLPYDICPIINDYRTWIGVKYDKEIQDLINILSLDNYDKIIIDHYGIDHVCEKELKKYCNELIVISDIFDYKHYCDIFINYTCSNEEKLYTINLNTQTKYLCGPTNAIINKKFKNIKKTKFRTKIEHVCILLGGSDPLNFTCKIIEILKDKLYNIKLTVVIGKLNSNKSNVINLLSTINNSELLFDLNYDDIINLYQEIDLCIGSLSTTAIERFVMNVPQVCLSIVTNQICDYIHSITLSDLDKINTLEDLKHDLYIV